MTKSSYRPIGTLSRASLDAMLEYIAEEVNTSESKEDLLAALAVARDMFTPNPVRSAVKGLNNIRAEIDCQALRNESAPQSAPNSCTLQLDVPSILSDTFKALSLRMNALQAEDPNTFANATSALTWLANGTIRTC